MCRYKTYLQAQAYFIGYFVIISGCSSAAYCFAIPFSDLKGELLFFIFPLTNISQYDILYPIHSNTMYRNQIYVSQGGDCLNSHIKRVYIPMTETAFYILLCLRSPNHGYGIVRKVERLTGGAIRLAPGTMYGSLSKMEKDGLIRFIREEEKRKIYEITDLGREVLQIELKRIERLYKISQEEMQDGNQKDI